MDWKPGVILKWQKLSAVNIAGLESIHMKQLGFLTLSAKAGKIKGEKKWSVSTNTFYTVYCFLCLFFLTNNKEEWKQTKKNQTNPPTQTKINSNKHKNTEYYFLNYFLHVLTNKILLHLLTETLIFNKWPDLWKWLNTLKISKILFWWSRICWILGNTKHMRVYRKRLIFKSQERQKKSILGTVLVTVGWKHYQIHVSAFACTPPSSRFQQCIRSRIALRVKQDFFWGFILFCFLIYLWAHFLKWFFLHTQEQKCVVYLKLLLKNYCCTVNPPE